MVDCDLVLLRFQLTRCLSVWYHDAFPACPYVTWGEVDVKWFTTWDFNVFRWISVQDLAWCYMSWIFAGMSSKLSTGATARWFLVTQSNLVSVLIRRVAFRLITFHTVIPRGALKNVTLGTASFAGLTFTERHSLNLPTIVFAEDFDVLNDPLCARVCARVTYGVFNFPSLTTLGQPTFSHKFHSARGPKTIPSCFQTSLHDALLLLLLENFQAGIWSRPTGNVVH